MANPNSGPPPPSQYSHYHSQPPPPNHNFDPNFLPTTPTGTLPHQQAPMMHNNTSRSGPGTEADGRNNAAQPDILDLLATYPFIQYTPSSRVARHLEGLNLTQSSSTLSDPSTLYPQYAGTFDQLNRGMGTNTNAAPEGPYGHAPQVSFQHQPQPQPQTQFPGQNQAQAYAQLMPQQTQTNPTQAQPQYTDRQVYDLNRQAALGYMDRWGGHVGQTRGSAQYGNGSHQQGYHHNHNQNGHQTYHQNGNGMSASPGARAQGMGMGAGSWIGGVRETINLSGGGSGRYPGQTSDASSNSNGAAMINPFTEFSQRVVPPLPHQPTGYGLSADLMGTQGYPQHHPSHSSSPLPSQHARQVSGSISSSSPRPNPPQRQANTYAVDQSGPFLEDYLAQIDYKRKAELEQERNRLLVLEQQEKREKERRKVEQKPSASVSVSPQKRRMGEDNGKTQIQTQVKVEGKKPKPLPSQTPMQQPGGIRLTPVVEIPMRKPIKMSGYRSPDEGSDDDEEDDEDEDELDDYGDGDYGEDYDMDRSTRRRRLSDSGMAMMTPGTYGKTQGTPSRRTGFTSAARSVKKDNHKVLYRFVEDIFEAEDAFPANLSEEDLKGSAEGPFDRLTRRARQDDKALLSRGMVERLSVLFKQCTRTARDRSKRGLIRTSGGDDGDVPENLSKWDTEELARLIKVLQRSMVEVEEDISIFPHDGHGVRTNREGAEEAVNGKGKPAKKKRRPAKVEDEEAADTMDEDKARKAVQGLNVLVDGLTAAECVLSLLTADDLAKPLYSEDLIREAIACASTAVGNVILPFLEALSGTSNVSSSVLAHITTQTDASARQIRQTLSVVSRSASRFLHRVTRLIAHEGLALPESLVYTITQLAVQLIFVVDPIVESKTGATARATSIWKEAMEGQAGTKALKAEAMDVLKTLYTRQGTVEREEILKEVLGSTAKVADLKKSQTGYRTRKGKTIHFVSALLLELMQDCAHGVRGMLEASDVAEMMETDAGETHAKPTSKLNITALAAYMDEMDRSAHFVLQYMLSKLSGANASKQKSSLEVNHKVILETFLEDQVEVLYMPEFPAAAISLGITARTLISILEENKPTAENATIRGIAIDHLGVLVSALRQYEMNNTGGEAPMNLRKIVQTGKQAAWTTLRDANHVLLQTLQKNASQNGLYSSAADVMTAKWLLELHRALRQESPEDGDDGEADTEMDQDPSPIMREIQNDLVRTSRKVDDESVFAHAKDDLLAQADRPCIIAEMARPLQSALGLIFKAILGCMGAPIVAHRTKAIKALGAAIAVDSAYLSRSDIRTSIHERISDSSPAVRDAAIDLVGKYIPDQPEVALQYYPSISSRIADTGPAVRKRVIKLFKVIYDLVSKRNTRIEICCKLVGLVDDEEDTVKDLALATLRDIWFPQEPIPGSRQARRSATPASTTSSRDSGEMLVHPIVDVVSRYSNDIVPVELAIREISKTRSKDLGQEYSQLIGAMLDRLMSNDNRSPADTLPLVRSIHLLSSAKPQSMDLQRATSLLPYLRQATTPDEVVLCETLMRIFRLSIPFLPKTASNFAVELSKILLPMIAKPSGKLSTLEEAVMCYCATVMHLTQEYGRILTILKSCIGKIRNETAKAQKTKDKKPLDQKTLPFIAAIATLLVAKSDLDDIRTKRDEVDDFVYEIAGDSMATFMFETLLDLWNLELDQTMRHAVIQCFGHLYQAFPTLMTDKQSIKVMDSVLTGESTNQQTTLKMLTLIHETLVTLVDSSSKDSAKKTTAGGPAPVDMEQLIGDTAGFAESGVGSAIIQRYIDKILHAALSRYDDIQKVAIDILSLTIHQGLAHPIQSFPIIVTLETSQFPHVSEKAFALHSHLQAKHASIINSRYFESAKVVFDHRRTIEKNVLGYSNPNAPVALLDRWYSLIRDKRPVRQDFLKAMCKAFSFEATPPAVTWDDVLLARFMAENLSLIEFKVQEEVLQIIAAMTALLAGLGMQVAEISNSVKIVGQPHDSLKHAKLVRDTENDDDMEQDDSQASAIDYDVEALINATAMVGIIISLKTRLKKTYGLTEDKVTKFVPGKKTAASDRATTRRITDGSGGLPDWSVLPGVKKRVETVAEFQDEAIAFTRLVEEDGTMRPEYSGEEDEDED